MNNNDSGATFSSPDRSDLKELNPAELFDDKEQQKLENQAQKILEEKDSEARTRSYVGVWENVVSIIAVIFALFQLSIASWLVMDAMTLRAWHILFLLTLAFLLFPARRRGKLKLKRPTVYDGLCALTGYFAFGYLILNYTKITLRGGFLLPIDYAAAIAGIIACFAMARRVAAPLALLAALFFAYNFFGSWIPGSFGHPGFSIRRVAEHMFWGSQGLMGIGVSVSATYVVLFVIFGSFLKYSGFSEFINDLALTLVGRTSGGPAKVSVLASAFMGMINGSALANVATTGAITIPLMKRTGYTPEFAGAVEAVASTGGQFAPPIMGAVGFIMAEFLGISYTKVMLAAAIPAFLYYLMLIMSVHFEARKLGLKGLSIEHIPNALKVLKERGHLLLPLVALLAVMFMGYTPQMAATISIVVTVAASWLSPSTRMMPKVIIKALNEGARSSVGVGVSCVIIGVIIGTVSLTGLGLTFGYQVLKYVQPGQIYLAGFFVMILSTILGMGVPGVAAYVIVAAVAVPVLIKIGVQPLAANMFCLFYACLSNITPPVAMSSYVAAGIAGSNETKTSLIAVRLGLAGFILPFFFLNNNLLLYSTGNDLLLTCAAIISAMLGIIALAAALEGWLFGRCKWFLRIMLLLAGFLAIDPGLQTDAVALALFVIAGLLNRYQSNRLDGAAS